MYADQFRAFAVVDFKLRSNVVRQFESVSIVDFVPLTSNYFYVTLLPQKCSVTIAWLYACGKLTRSSFESLVFVVSVASMKLVWPEANVSLSPWVAKHDAL